MAHQQKRQCETLQPERRVPRSPVVVVIPLVVLAVTSLPGYSLEDAVALIAGVTSIVATVQPRGSGRLL